MSVKTIKVGQLAILMLLCLSIGGNEITSSEGHVTSGQRKVVGGYVVQFDTNPPFPAPDEKVSLLFSLQDSEGNNLENVKVSIRVSRENETVLELPERAHRFGDFTIDADHIFDKEGPYKVLITFDQGEKRITTDFDVTVSKSSALYAYVSIIPFFLIVALAFFFYRRSVFREEQPRKSIRRAS